MDNKMKFLILWKYKHEIPVNKIGWVGQTRGYKMHQMSKHSIKAPWLKLSEIIDNFQKNRIKSLKIDLNKYDSYQLRMMALQLRGGGGGSILFRKWWWWIWISISKSIKLDPYLLSEKNIHLWCIIFCMHKNFKIKELHESINDLGKTLLSMTTLPPTYTHNRQSKRWITLTTEKYLALEIKVK